MSEKEWDERVKAMYADEVFMEWLEEYSPYYHSEYTGNLLGLHDAFKAGLNHE